MYLLVQSDRFCELNISKDIINLFDFSKPYVEEEIEVINELTEIIEGQDNVTEDKLVKHFNEQTNFDIIKIS
ncbi:hypothetical protein [Haloplasma contractile]|uniref:Uncharacterized protein n=1 Tax=Haloplasma contractile SSD-17B TaxID=1033810 RepID=U2FSF7_9MOLU|nr:hypothetical protein [Haloplasma contractile]ERJ13869.1 hypothetical protein HLPCO_000535 [Haloplasma contractile SSD-17B]